MRHESVFKMVCFNSNILPLYLVPLALQSSMRYLPGDLISQLLTGNNRNLLAYSLVGVEVVGESGVILLDNHPRGLFHRLRSYSSLGRKDRRTWSTTDLANQVPAE